MTTMISLGKSLPNSLTEDSSAPGCPLSQCTRPSILYPDWKPQCWYRHRPDDTYCYCVDCIRRRMTKRQEMFEQGRMPLHHFIPSMKNLEHELKLAEAHIAEQDRVRNRKKYKEVQTRDLGPREFTLTYTPHWYDDDTDAQNAMRCAVEKLTRYYKDEIIEFHAIGEFTRNGRSHVHGWYHLIGGLKITDKNFKRAWKHWNPKRKLNRGFEGGHHETINRVSDFAGYTEKHLEEAWLEIHINNGVQEDNDSQEDNSPYASQDDSPSSASDSESSESGRSEHV